ncbi:hypothetical protein LDENG_00085030, partial [Lucifuga dentata]
NTLSIRSLQLVQNAVARILTKTRKYDHVTPVLASLQSTATIRTLHAGLLVIPSVNKKSVGFRAFSYCASYLWNGHVKEASSAEMFKSRLKTHLYSLHYSLNVSFQTSC